ncbi:MAG: hypothetical protein HIU84_04160 [Acidobacteria bacterium]|nr:hypothetical protein [Acidobacteriota bacterium]
MLNEEDSLTAISPTFSLSGGSDPCGAMPLRQLLNRIRHLPIEELGSALLLTDSTPHHWWRDPNAPLNPVAPLPVVPSSQNSHISLLLRFATDVPPLLRTRTGVHCNVVSFGRARITVTSSALKPGLSYEHHPTTNKPRRVKDGSSQFGPSITPRAATSPTISGFRPTAGPSVVAKIFANARISSSGVCGVSGEG